MQLLLILSSTGALSGLLSGAYISGMEGMFLGASSGLVAGVVIWALAGIGMRTLREYRLNQYFEPTNPDLNNQTDDHLNK